MARRATSPAQAKAERSVDLRAVGSSAGERVVGRDRPTHRVAGLEDDLERRQVDREIAEEIRAANDCFAASDWLAEAPNWVTVPVSVADCS